MPIVTWLRTNVCSTLLPTWPAPGHREGKIVHPFWSAVAFAEHAAIAGTGAANAAYFAHRGYSARGARRTGALLLTVLFAAISLDALAAVGLSEPGAAGALLRAPLLLANAATGAVIALGAGR